MAPETDEQARREAESIERQMRLLEQRRGETQVETKSAARRLVLVVVTTALVALALWWMMN